MKKVIIIGCPGAGKSTLAMEMGKKTGLPVVHLDSLFWLPGWTQRPRKEFDLLLQESLQKDAWIIDGNYGRTIPLRLAACDTVVYLDFQTIVCILGVIRRVITNYGKTRVDMGEDCPERFDWAFMKYVWNFNRKERKKLHRAIEENRDKEIIVLKNRRQIKKYLNSL